MTKSRNSDRVGDSLSVPLKPSVLGLACSPVQAMSIGAETAQASMVLTPLASLACSLGNRNSTVSVPNSCEQILWFSFFFDGTGNNQDADLGSLKHSNVVKLFRAHVNDNSDLGIYKFYVPGVGTYFPAVNDDGGSIAGNVSGAMGEERLDWAVKQFDESIRLHLQRAQSPANTIREINLSIFGFSRGAALARAFSNIFLEKRCERSAAGVWALKTGKYVVRIRFMGLFDTVASVGLPMSSNNGSVVGSATRDVAYTIKHRLDNEARTRPHWLAFATDAAPGSDPSPGTFDGHKGYGGRLAIPHMVEEVRHFVAAHELRNSFPLDSVSIEESGKIIKPPHFYETVYPGVHSDVGGSYRPGEGGRSQSPEKKLGLIPLVHMYIFAQARNVPLRPLCALEKEVQEDFRAEVALRKDYDYYQTRVGSSGSLGQLMNLHMFLYYSWRFYSIRKKEKGDHAEANEIRRQSASFKSEENALLAEIATLERTESAAKAELKRAEIAKENYMKVSVYVPIRPKAIAELDEGLASAQRNHGKARDALLRAKARLDSLPKMGGLNALIDLYDRQLVSDAKSIYAIYGEPSVYSKTPRIGLRKQLKPHYRALMDAYENEYLTNKGLTDTQLIHFFEQYVHDSLAGFSLDATLPSDPRVIYLGGDVKYRYAALSIESASRSA